MWDARNLEFNSKVNDYAIVVYKTTFQALSFGSIGWNYCEQFQAILDIFWGWHHCFNVIVVLFVANRPYYPGTHILFHPEQNTIIRVVICGCSWFLIFTNHKNMAFAVHFFHLNGGPHHCQVHQNPHLAPCIYIGLLILKNRG